MSKNNLPADERRAFNDLLDRVRNLENDKDRFLEAAHLERLERPPMSDTRFCWLLTLIGICVFIVALATVMIVGIVF